MHLRLRYIGSGGSCACRGFADRLRYARAVAHAAIISCYDKECPILNPRGELSLTRNTAKLQNFDTGFGSFFISARKSLERTESNHNSTNCCWLSKGCQREFVRRSRYCPRGFAYGITAPLNWLID